MAMGGFMGRDTRSRSMASPTSFSGAFATYWSAGRRIRTVQAQRDSGGGRTAAEGRALPPVASLDGHIRPERGVWRRSRTPARPSATLRQATGRPLRLRRHGRRHAPTRSLTKGPLTRPSPPKTEPISGAILERGTEPATRGSQTERLEEGPEIMLAATSQATSLRHKLCT